MLVLDTSVVSALMRREGAALARARALRPGDLVLCTPVAAEIGYGIARLEARSRRRQLLQAEYQRWRAVLPWRDWDEEAAGEFARQKVLLERAGTPVADMDVIIGSIALSMGAGVATANVRHFEKLHGLRVDDWTRG